MKNEAIIDGMTVAGQPTDEEIRNLKARGFETLVNVRPGNELDEPEAPKALAAGLRYAEVGFTGNTLNTEHVRLIKQALVGATGPVVIHCAGGTRAAVIAGILSAEKRKQGAAEALRQMAMAGFDVSGTPYELFVHRYFADATREIG